MRKLIAAIGIIMILIIAPVSCAIDTGIPYWHSIAYADTSGQSSGNVMIVFYTIADDLYLFWCDLDAEITDNGDGTWDITSAQVNARGVSQAIVTYSYYQYKDLVLNCCDEDGKPLPTYLPELDLQPVTADDLPKSQHIGVLTAVDPALARPATVTRKWHGVLYDVQCLVDQDIVDMYQAGDLNIGDYVIVSFIDEIPNTTELNIAIITGKVFESWP